MRVQHIFCTEPRASGPQAGFTAGDVQTEFSPGDHYQSIFVGSVLVLLALLVLLVLKVASTFNIFLFFLFFACLQIQIHISHVQIFIFLSSRFVPTLPISFKLADKLGGTAIAIVGPHEECRPLQPQLIFSDNVDGPRRPSRSSAAGR